jgi:hypothetical protein
MPFPRRVLLRGVTASEITVSQPMQLVWFSPTLHRPRHGGKGNLSKRRSMGSPWTWSGFLAFCQKLIEMSYANRQNSASPSSAPIERLFERLPFPPCPAPAPSTALNGTWVESWSTVPVDLGGKAAGCTVARGGTVVRDTAFRLTGWFINKLKL